MMFDFDQRLAKYCSEHNLIYTRYADDIFISAREHDVLSDALLATKEFAFLCPYANLKVNGKKTAFLSRRYHREITGLVITSDDRISLGRARKREIKSLAYDLVRGELQGDRLEYLKGMIGFAADAEPTFVHSLHRKYGEELAFLLHDRKSKITTTFSMLEQLDPPEDSR